MAVVSTPRHLKARLSPGPASAPDRSRVEAIDVLRGLVIALMALDHVRDFLHVSGYALNPLDPRQTTTLLYVTRWVTHFCAPTFVFLAGVSAWLLGARGKSTSELSRRLLARGLWLVFLELTVIGFGWAWSIPFMPFLQVIWAIGWSMVLLALCVRLPARAVLVIGAAVIAGHNLFDAVSPGDLGRFGVLWQLVRAGGVLRTPDGGAVLASYPILPWFGMMAFGYGLAWVFIARARDRLLHRVGGAMLLLFLVLRIVNVYGDPRPWAPRADLRSTAMAFMDVTKYPPSLQFVTATLGPVLLAFPLLARWKGPLASVLRIYGAVPLMAYLAHIYVVHTIAVVSRVATGQDAAGLKNAIYNFVLNSEAMGGTGLPLWFVYPAWIAVLAIIYPLCRWWAQVKATHQDWWLSYL
jgi:uncharacterized membrane protein